MLYSRLLVMLLSRINFTLFPAGQVGAVRPRSANAREKTGKIDKPRFAAASDAQRILAEVFKPKHPLAEGNRTGGEQKIYGLGVPFTCGFRFLPQGVQKWINGVTAFYGIPSRFLPVGRFFANDDAMQDLRAMGMYSSYEHNYYIRPSTFAHALEIARHELQHGYQALLGESLYLTDFIQCTNNAELLALGENAKTPVFDPVLEKIIRQPKLTPKQHKELFALYTTLLKLNSSVLTNIYEKGFYDITTILPATFIPITLRAIAILNPATDYFQLEDYFLAQTRRLLEMRAFNSQVRTHWLKKDIDLPLLEKNNPLRRMAMTSLSNSFFSYKASGFRALFMDKCRLVEENPDARFELSDFENRAVYYFSQTEVESRIMEESEAWQCIQDVKKGLKLTGIRPTRKEAGYIRRVETDLLRRIQTFQEGGRLLLEQGSEAAATELETLFHRTNNLHSLAKMQLAWPLIKFKYATPTQRQALTVRVKEGHALADFMEIYRLIKAEYTFPALDPEFQRFPEPPIATDPDYSQFLLKCFAALDAVDEAEVIAASLSPKSEADPRLKILRLFPVTSARLIIDTKKEN